MIHGIRDLKKRAGLMSRRSICNDRPAIFEKDVFRSGNGSIILKDDGQPLENRIEVSHELLWCPQWEEPPKAPLLADILPQVQQLILERKFTEAENLVDRVATERGLPPRFRPSRKHDALQMVIKRPDMSVEEYLHIQNMESGELNMHWENMDGVYENRAFVSRADQIAVVRLTAPEKKLNCEVSFAPPHIEPQNSYGEKSVAGDEWIDNTLAPVMKMSHWNGMIVLEGQYSYHQGNFIAMIRPVCKNGKIKTEDNRIIITGGTECMFMIAVERSREEENPVTKESVYKAFSGISEDYNELLERHTVIHGEIFKRVNLNLKGDDQDYLLTNKELKQKEFMADHILPVYMEKMLDMGRYFLLCESGQFPPIYGHVNINVNHQISGGNIGNMPELMNVFFNWIEWQMRDARENAYRTLGTQGFLIACHPDEESGRNYHVSRAYPHEYWISSSGWCLQPFLEHYYCTGDEKFLKERMIPLYKELAPLYFDFLTIRDENDNYVFVPSYSAENFPTNYGSMMCANSAMDVAVCREVMLTLLNYGGDDVDDKMKKKCQEVLEHLPPYMIGDNGEIKEWIEADYEERHDHRHISQLYGVYPGDEIQPELDMDLYKNARYTNRLRAMENESCHGVMHRAQIAARLKDSKLVEELLRFFLESGFVTESFTTVHNPYLKGYMPDGQGAFPTVVMESILYSRPGFIELLPAADTSSFRNGRLEGVQLRSFASAEWLDWNNNSISFGLKSRKKQKICLCYRKGIRNLQIEGGKVLRIDDIYAEIYLDEQIATITLER